MTASTAIPAAALTLCMLGASAAAAPAPIVPTSYDMTNGCVCYSGYGDGSYSAGGGAASYGALSGGSGDLTDGVIPVASWNVNAVPYVGWQSEVVPAPTITFHFASAVNLGAVTLHYDDSNGAGGVFTPLGFSFRKLGGPTLTQTVIDLVGSAPASTTLTFGSALVGDTFVLEVDNSRGAGKWVMLSEVTFTTAAVPLPAAAPLMLIGLGALGLIGRRRG